MRAIVIGAGRGSRLQHETSEIPKTMVEVMGRPMLDWVLDALAEGGFARKDVVFICGYAEAVVKSRYPELTFVRNSAWESNNILASLLYARDYLGDGFVSTYADIVYEGAVVKKLVDSPESIALGCDTACSRSASSWSRSALPSTERNVVCAICEVAGANASISVMAAAGEMTRK
jgi:choline kinase